MKMSIETFLTRLLALRQSILSFSTGEKFDLNRPDSDFAIGYDAVHTLILKAKLHRAAQEGAGLVVREFNPETIAVALKGAIRRIPTKNLYHFLAQDGGIYTVPAEIAEESQNTDHRTGKPLEPEPGVFFRELAA